MDDKISILFAKKRENKKRIANNEYRIITSFGSKSDNQQYPGRALQQYIENGAGNLAYAFCG